VEWLQALVASHRADEDVIALAYTNEAVDYINALCRDEICNNPDDPFVVGERLVFASTYSPTGSAVFAESATVHQGTTITVDSVRRGAHLNVPCWFVNKYPVLDRDQKTVWRERLALAKAGAIKSPALWRSAYYPLLEDFAHLAPGYCTTVHKSQGSTYDRVFVAQHNILTRCKDAIDRNRLLYVAYSRARKSLWVT
jgi:exodeoxyribonuclease-5